MHDEDDESVLAQAVAVFVHGVYRQIAEITQDNEQAVRDDLSEHVRTFVWLLVGLESNE